MEESFKCHLKEKELAVLFKNRLYFKRELSLKDNKIMWKCGVCKKVDVSDKGFKAFVHYDLISVWAIEREKFPVFGRMCQQVRICSKCLKKKSVEINLN